MHKVFIFDVDGTLTPSRQIMTNQFQKFFNTWSDKNNFYLVSGSDLEKIKEQVPEDILSKAKGIFTCAGNKFYKVKHIPFEDNRGLKTPDGLPMLSALVTEYSLEYENKFEPPKDLIDYLEHELLNSQYPHRYGNHIENRGSMVNFSIVGRDCTLEQRLDFFEWDEMSKDRKRIADKIKKHFLGIDASIGGQISIDIYETGDDKSQVIEYLKNPNNDVDKYDEFIFMGDRIHEGGNDYPLAKVMNDMENCKVFSVDGYEETQHKLEEIND